MMKNVEMGRLPIIELVGVAGAGKSTLRGLLLENDRRIEFVVPPAKRSYFPFVVKNTATWLPSYIAHLPEGRWLNGKEMRIMGYLETWIPHLHKQILATRNRIVLDPGSVYWLTALRYFAPEFFKGHKFEKWWNKMLVQWASVLEMIVWIDASETILYDRVLARDEWHEAKEQRRDEALEIFKRLREGYEEVVAAMKANGRLKVLQFCSERTPPEEIAHRVFTALNENEFWEEMHADNSRNLKKNGPGPSEDRKIRLS